MNSNSERYAEIKQNLCRFAEETDAVRAVIAIGSTTRSDIPADEFSDLDLFIVTESPEGWLSGEYPRLFGNVSISFVEPTLGGGMERRCIYDEDKDTDMIILTPLQFEKALKEGAAQWVMNRGYRILCDKDGYEREIPKYVNLTADHADMTEKEFTNVVSDFFFHNIWACKKLKRGELWSAKICIDAYLKKLLLKIIEEYQLCMGTEDVWHDGRFLERWADNTVLEGLKDCFAHYDADDCRRALQQTHRLFSQLSKAAAEKKGFEYPEIAEKCAEAYIMG